MGRRRPAGTLAAMWLWVVLAVVCTFVIAAVSIGVVSGSLAQRPRRSVYDIEEAVDFVADRLPDEVTAEVSFDDVRSVLLFHCDYLAAKGVASERTADDIGTALVVVPDDEPIAYILGRVTEAGLDLSDEQVVTILDAETRYYEAIGAFGPRSRSRPIRPDRLTMRTLRRHGPDPCRDHPYDGRCAVPTDPQEPRWNVPASSNTTSTSATSGPRSSTTSMPSRARTRRSSRS